MPVEEVGLGLKLLGFGKKYWADIAVFLAAFGLIVWAWHAHDRAIRKLHDTAYQEGIDAQKAIDATAVAAANARANAINSNLRTKSDEEARSISSSADTVRVRGPGKAVCPGVTAAPSAAGGRLAPGGTGPADVASVRDSGGSDLIALPFADTVTVVEQCALNRAEDLTWRKSDQQQAQPQEK